MEANRILNIIMSGSVGPVVILVSIIIMVWYAGAVYLNSSFLIDRYEKINVGGGFAELASGGWGGGGGVGGGGHAGGGGGRADLRNRTPNAWGSLWPCPW